MVSLSDPFSVAITSARAMDVLRQQSRKSNHRFIARENLAIFDASISRSAIAQNGFNCMRAQ